ncbi:MAG TPA: NlpC/P60 family protein [Actinomycetota bacterium]|nr:NlpC/P60 family protein [Actinomycetota bacterium]
MAERGDGLRRRVGRIGAALALSVLLVPLTSTAARATPASWRDGEDGSGAPAPRVTLSRTERARVPTASWSDLRSDDVWARPAIDHVAGVHDWMRDVRPDADGAWRFRPDAIETRQLWARALVRAFAPDEAADASITFPDLDASSRFWKFAAIAVKHRWLARGSGGRFNPSAPITARAAHRSLVLVLGMRQTAAALDHLSTTDGYAFDTPKMFGFNLLALRLGLRFNNKVDEAQDVTPGDALRRKQAAWSLYRASTIDPGFVTYLEEQYAGIALPKMGAGRRSIVDWGVRYVGYPYIWAGEWGFESTPPAAFGGQPGPGFDCSGITWWALRRDDGVYWEISPPRPHEGWPLPQRSSAEMARVTTKKLGYRHLLPGDLMFYDGDGNGVVDHVDVYVGRGWALDSSSSIAGVTLMWVGTGWYREHFVHGRRILPSP